MKQSIGILGGMGPLATCDMMQTILLHTDAKSDQEFPRIYVDCNTNIPDRTAAIVGNGDSPIAAMVESAKKLQTMGADFLVMPCNTAHYFAGDIQKEVGIQIVHMIEETAKQLVRDGVKTVGVLATSGTISSGLYTNILEESGIKALIPEMETGQKEVMNLIYEGIKKGDMNFPIGAFLEVVKGLFDDGAECVILGCTELPIAWELYKIEYPFINPTEVVARTAVALAGYPLKDGGK